MNRERPLEHPPHLLTPEKRAEAERLIGSCQSEPDWLGDLSVEEAREFDNIVFMCQDCGWWCAAEECNETGEGWSCDECTKEHHS